MATAIIVAVSSVVAAIGGAYVSARVRPPTSTPAEEWRALFVQARADIAAVEERAQAAEARQTARIDTLAAQLDDALREVADCHRERVLLVDKVDHLERQVSAIGRRSDAGPPVRGMIDDDDDDPQT